MGEYMKATSRITLASAVYFFGLLAFAQMTTTNLYHVKGDRDHYEAVTGGKKVEVLTEACLHKAEDENGSYVAFNGKPYTITFANHDDCKAVSFKEIK